MHAFKIFKYLEIIVVVVVAVVVAVDQLNLNTKWLIDKLNLIIIAFFRHQLKRRYSVLTKELQYQLFSI